VLYLVHQFLGGPWGVMCILLGGQQMVFEKPFSVFAAILLALAYHCQMWMSNMWGVVFGVLRSILRLVQRGPHDAGTAV